MNLQEHIERLQWYIEQLAEIVTPEEAATTSLAIRLKWSKDDLRKAEEILDTYERLLEETPSHPCSFLERDLRELRNVGYQEVKRIVCAFYDEGRFVDVCRRYAEGQVPCPTELKRLLGQ